MLSLVSETLLRCSLFIYQHGENIYANEFLFFFKWDAQFLFMIRDGLAFKITSPKDLDLTPSIHMGAHKGL